MKLIIAGSRSLYVSPIDISKHVEEAGFVPTEIVSGAAPGIDRCGERYAEWYRLTVKLFPANWNDYGRAAGPMRNREMAEYADALLAIWDGKSPGTKNMIQQMQRRGKPCHVINKAKLRAV
jgi:hypothetical protein